MKEFFKKYHSYFFISALFIGITAPALWTDGMFTDGTIYAVISRNLAEGFGTFWNMKFSETFMNPFFGHPPLAFYLESFGFRIFGDSIYIERIYSFLTGLLAIVLIIFILKSFLKTGNKSVIIISLLVWLSFPLINWAYSNNMLENTVTVFTLLSFLFLLKSYNGKRFRMLFISGIFLFAGFLSKGFTALFILSVPVIYWLVYRKISFYRMVTDTLFFFVFTALPLIFIIFFSENAAYFFERYFNEQIIGSIKNVVTVNSRFYIVGSMLNEMIIPSIFTVFLFIILKIKKIKPHFENKNLKNALFFFLISLSGILPVMISMKQRSFYIVPALPFLAISFGFVINNLLSRFPKFLNFFKKSFFIRLSYGFLGLSILLIFLFAGNPGRDFDVLYDIHIIVKEIPKKSKIKISKGLHSDWLLYAYMQRYGKISVSDTIDAKFFMTKKNIISDKRNILVKLNLNRYFLFKKIGK